MGAMKLVNGWTRISRSLVHLAPEDRAAVNLLLKHEALVRAAELEMRQPQPEAGGCAGDNFGLHLTSTGGMPTQAGLYLLIDTCSDTRTSVQVVNIGAKQWRVRCLGDATLHRLEDYNRRYYSWFFIADLTSTDAKMAAHLISAPSTSRQ